MRWMVVSGIALLAIGCSKKPAVVDAAQVPPAAVASVDSKEAASPGGQAIEVPGAAARDPTADLDALTQALRKYSIEHRVLPKTFAEVVAAGYVKNLPAAPPGKKFEIDPKSSRVALVNQ